MTDPVTDPVITDPTATPSDESKTNEAKTNEPKTPEAATPMPKAFVPPHRSSPIASQSFKPQKGGSSFNKPMMRRAARGR